MSSCYFPAVPLVLYYLYDNADINGFEIVYDCAQTNPRTGICEIPQIFVNTRVSPDKLSASDKLAIDAIIEKTLRPYCMGAADLQAVIFRTDLAPCDTSPTQDFLNLLEGFQLGLPRRV